MSDNPDAALIAACAHYRACNDALNAAAGLTDDDPRWATYYAALAAVDGLQPQTMDGLVAKARMTLAEATHPNGEVELEAYSAEWALDLVRDLVRFGGRA